MSTVEPPHSLDASGILGASHCSSCMHPRRGSWREIFFLSLSICLALPFLGQMAFMLLGFSPLLSPWQSFVLASLAQILGAINFYRLAFNALRKRQMTMEVLISLGILVAYIYSVVALLLGAFEHLYFETSAVLVAVLSLGRFLEARSQRQAGSFIQDLLQKAPKRAWVQREGRWIEVAAEQVVVGDRFRVGVGEVFPVDGEVLEGTSSADESMIFGESLPRAKKPHDTVYAGSLNHYGVLEGRALRSGKETVFAKIVQSVESIQSAKPPIQRLADKVCGIFVPFVVFVSVTTWISWWIGGHAFEEGMLNAICVLLVACPCALGMATPMVMVQASKEASRAGIFVKDARILEVAHRTDCVLFDKTGTLTQGRLQGVKTYLYEGGQEHQLWSMIASLEHAQSHPVAKILFEYATKEGGDVLPVQDLRVHAGRGVVGVIDGQTCLVGSLSFLEEQKVQLPALKGDETSFSWVGVACRGVLFARLALEDPLRMSAKPAVQELKGMGVQTSIVSGDRTDIVARMAKTLGIDDFLGEVLPQDKVAFVQKKKASGYAFVAMVGDGLNDAPSLAQADLGIAMGSSSEFSLMTAGAVLMNGSLLGVPQLLALSKQSVKKIRQNLAFSFGFNTLGILLAAFGHLSPMIAGLAMALSSIVVVRNALSLRLAPAKPQ